MVKRVCINCGVTIEGENSNNYITGGICIVCWTLREDARKYERMELPNVANYLRAVLRARNHKNKGRKR